MTRSISPETSTAPNWPLLSLLRFGLALIVFATHLDMVFGAGANPLRAVVALGPFAAVMSFFAVSGYSIRHAITKHDTRTFYARRARRIMPALFGAQIVAAVALAIGGGFIGWPGGGSVELPGRGAVDGLLLFFIHSLPLQSAALLPPAWNMPAWSLGIEAFYYLLAPALLLLPRRALWLCVAVSAVLFFYFDTRETFSIGAGPHIALALAWAWLLGWLLVDANDFERQIIALAPIVSMGVCHQHRGAFDTLTVAATALLMVNGHRIALPVHLRGAATWAGDFSYTLYICHWPALLLCVALKMPPLAVIFAALAVCVVAHMKISAAMAQRGKLRRYALLNPAPNQ